MGDASDLAERAGAEKLGPAAECGAERGEEFLDRGGADCGFGEGASRGGESALAGEAEPFEFFTDGLADGDERCFTWNEQEGEPVGAAACHERVGYCVVDGGDAEAERGDLCGDEGGHVPVECFRVGGQVGPCGEEEFPAFEVGGGVEEFADCGPSNVRVRGRGNKGFPGEVTAGEDRAERHGLGVGDAVTERCGRQVAASSRCGTRGVRGVHLCGVSFESMVFEALTCAFSGSRTACSGAVLADHDSEGRR